MEKEGEVEESVVVVTDLWTEDGKSPYWVTQLSSAGAFRKKGGTIALYDQDELFAYWLKGNRGGRGWRTVVVWVRKPNSKYVVASKGFQKLTLHFYYYYYYIVIITFIVLHYCINVIVNICMYVITINVIMLLAQSVGGMCVSMVHSDDCCRAVWDM